MQNNSKIFTSSKGKLGLKIQYANIYNRRSEMFSSCRHKKRMLLLEDNTWAPRPRLSHHQIMCWWTFVVIWVNKEFQKGLKVAIFWSSNINNPAPTHSTEGLLTVISTQLKSSFNSFFNWLIIFCNFFLSYNTNLHHKIIW